MYTWWVIGGIGMSSIAAVLLSRGYRVTGSDLCLSELTDKLVADGATVYEGPRPKTRRWGRCGRLFVCCGCEREP